MPVYRICEYKTVCRTYDIKANSKRAALKGKGEVVDERIETIDDDYANETELLGIVDPKTGLVN